LSSIDDTNDDTTTQLSSDDESNSPRAWTRVVGRMVRSPSNSPSSLANMATTSLANNYFALLMDTDDDDDTSVANEAAHLDPDDVIGEIRLTICIKFVLQPQNFLSGNSVELHLKIFKYIIRNDVIT